MTGSDQPKQEFHTWKEISEYLGVSVREAQDREKNEGLPIRRLGGSKPRVWALRSELDQWKVRVSTKSVFAATIQPVAGQQPPDRRFSRRRLIAGIGGCGLVGFGIAALTKPHRTLARAILEGNLLTAIDGLGRTLWTHRFSDLEYLKDSELAWRTQIVDFEGNQRPAAVVACRFRTRDELYCFSSDGHVQWMLPCQPDLLDYAGHKFEPDWRYSHIVVSPSGNGHPVIFASIKNESRFPGCVQRVDHLGHSTIQFVNAGNLECLCYVPRADGGCIAICGENNSFDQTCAALIGVDDHPSCSPVGGPPRYSFSNSPLGIPRSYVLFPTLELTKANGGSYAHANDVGFQGGFIVVHTDVVSHNCQVIYEFSDNLEARIAAPSGSCPSVHKQFEDTGVLKHSWEKCPELAKPLTLRRCDQLGRWRDYNVPWRLPNNLV